MNTEFYLCTFLMTLFHLVESQFDKFRPPADHCHKYCFKNCDVYYEKTTYWTPSLTVYYTRNTDEYRDCINAHAHCDCATRATLRNPLLVFGLTLTGIVLILAVVRYIKKRRREQQELYPGIDGSAVIAYRITPTVSSRVEQAQNQGGNTFCFANPAFSSHTNDSPPEYLPPPSYQECFNNISPKSDENEIKQEEKK